MFQMEEATMGLEVDTIISLEGLSYIHCIFHVYMPYAEILIFNVVHTFFSVSFRVIVNLKMSSSTLYRYLSNPPVVS